MTFKNSTAQQERAALVTTMRGVGPEQPTLCGDWTTRDLAAHLVVRERRLDAAPGIMIPALADYTDRVQKRVAAENDWNVLLDKIASGPPTLSPFKLLDSLVNVSEMFIHHEDVRRANGQSRRTDRPDLDAVAWKASGFTGRRVARQIRPYGLEIRTPSGASRRCRRR